MKPKRVLVAALDWGLGHATRCIPIIKELIHAQCEVIIAGSGSSLTLLKTEFPQLKVVQLPAYGPVYPSRGSMVLKIIMQLPKFIKAIKREHAIIENFVREKQIHCVISDNRFGCCSKHAYTIFITHQVNILLPNRWKWLRGLVNFINHHHIKKFNLCWIPDEGGENNLTGSMSAGFSRSRFIGKISRFTPCISHNNKLDFDILCILSGPEPQRTLLERLLTTQIATSKLKAIMVRGIPEASHRRTNDQLEIVDFMGSRELQDTICQSRLIIARSGYSTVMDMATLGKQAVFIPTPGQTEQEYLAEHLKIKKITYSINQSKFDLTDAMARAADYSGFKPTINSHTELINAIADMLKII